jgi:hypothetical protein
MTWAVMLNETNSIFLCKCSPSLSNLPKKLNYWRLCKLLYPCNYKIPDLLQKNSNLRTKLCPYYKDQSFTLILLKEIFFIFDCEGHTKNINTLCGQMWSIRLSVNVSGTQVNLVS